MAENELSEARSSGNLAALTEVLLEEGKARALAEREPRILDNDQERRTWLVPKGDGTTEIMVFEHDPPDIRIQIHSVDDLVRYIQAAPVHAELRRDAKLSEVRVYVDSDNGRITADLAAHERRVWQAVLPLAITPEFFALRDLALGRQRNTPRELWRRLVTDLADAVDSLLADSLRHIKIRKDGGSEVIVEETGITKASSENAATITFPLAGKQGQAEATLLLDWNWIGSIYQAFDAEVTIPFLLELELTDEGLGIAVHPRNIAKHIQATVAALTEYLQTELKDAENVLVVAGSPTDRTAATRGEEDPTWP